MVLGSAECQIQAEEKMPECHFLIHASHERRLKVCPETLYDRARHHLAKQAGV